MRVIMFGLIYFLSACSQPATDQSKNQSSSSENDVKKELLTLEQKWLEAEFALDTAAISPMLDPTFVSINDNDTSNKQQELKGIYENMSTMRKDSIFLDSLKLEETIINIYGNTAVVIPKFHTYKTDKGKPVEKRMRFYDVWINRDGKWKAVASQVTVISN